MSETCGECGSEMSTDERGYLFCRPCLDLSFLGFCGCGMPEETAAWLIGELETLRYPETPAEWFIAYQFDRLDLTEHGTSIGHAWLTDLGKKTLEALKTGKGKP